MPHLPITFESPVVLAVAIVLVVLCAAVALFRRALIARRPAVLMLIGLALLALSAGQMRWRKSATGEIAVMIDVSPSARVASYHDERVLRERIEQLMGSTPYRVYHFAAQTSPGQIDDIPPEIPTQRTVFSPPIDASAIVLFSDGQFDVPAMVPPTYPVVDPALDRADDAAVENIEAHDDRVSVTVRNSGQPRDLVFSGGGATPSTQPIELDHQVLSAQVADASAEVTARIQSQDAWPENDLLTVRPPPPIERQRWWISRNSPPDASWRHIPPEQTPLDGTEYLAAGVIALDNVSPTEMQQLQRERVEQYVRELGGGMLILGGDRAFASGGYTGTWFEQLSPLASNPPQPTTHWILLADSSGSMSARIGDNTRWRFATTAIMELIPILPPSDPLSVGNFASEVRWWQRGHVVGNTDRSHLVPDEVRPQGPTNLRPALLQVLEEADGKTRTQLVLITDAEANLGDPQPLLERLSQELVTVHALTTADLSADHPLRALVEGTGGKLIAQEDPRRWMHELQQMLRGASMPWLMRERVNVRFTEAAPQLPSESARVWNRTWLKPNATALAEAGDGENVPMAAAWNYGGGAVISVAYSPSPRVVHALAERVALPPRDPRFQINWDIGRRIHITIDAQQDGRHLNDLGFRLEFLDDSPRPNASQAFVQTAPGRYELRAPPLSRTAIASIALNAQILDRRALPAQYAQEFDGIGNNLAALKKLAERTGGEVIEPTRTTPIKFAGQGRYISLASWLAAAGATSIAAGLIVWRLG